MNLRAQITRWVSDDNPGIVECRFTDRFDREWTFVEKRPVVTAADVWSDSEFPQPASIGCEVVSRGRDDAGREIAEISTEKPWGIELTDETTRFHVFADQLIEEGD